ncbi:putative short chain dehydrogenase/ reductase [Patellaria atrata CBS 101060]|uniref:3-dehydrosphinganine reductase n=1 Tax=Patellaria atrata CBS 101060 TaxID=1346257 RepID=A0A9P4S8X8_9PEZI|nr:putative short chain dehydrogenase/ reductase [Patellaria atrata CBS 101060]
MRGKTVFIAGGSAGLGKEIAKQLAAQGADITIFARGQGQLDEAKKEILAERIYLAQTVHAVSIDLGDASKVQDAFKSQDRLPDVLYCVAGGTTHGFFTDLDARDLESCMKKNYFTAAYTAQSILRLWTEDDKAAKTTSQRLRQIIFITSAAAFLGVPGYAAYTASKCAVRALADTLRMEVLRHPDKVSTYTVHCAFPSTFITEAFVEEQKMKPELTKRIEGTLAPIEELEKQYPSATRVAEGIIAGVSRGDFAICDDSPDTSYLFASMIGPSPKRGLGVVDTFLAAYAGWFITPRWRRGWEKMCKREALRARL